MRERFGQRIVHELRGHRRNKIVLAQQLLSLAHACRQRALQECGHARQLQLPCQRCVQPAALHKARHLAGQVVRRSGKVRELQRRMQRRAAFRRCQPLFVKERRARQNRGRALMDKA